TNHRQDTPTGLLIDCTDERRRTDDYNRDRVFEKEKRCSKCGESFQCGGLFGCWCRDVKLDVATLVDLRAKYADCLCPACLKPVVRPSEDQHPTISSHQSQDLTPSASRVLPDAHVRTES